MNFSYDPSRIGFTPTLHADAPRDQRYHRAPEFRHMEGPYRVLVCETGYTIRQHQQMSAELAERALSQLD